MNVSKLVMSYVLTTVVFFAIDLLWLGVVAKGIYSKYLKDFLADQVNWTAAIIFYLLYIIGIFIFAIQPGVERESLGRAMVLGALFGFFTYATYDLTNLATLRGWPIQIVVIDIIWGAVLTAVVAAAGYSISKWLS